MGIVCVLYCVGEFMKKAMIILMCAIFILGCTRYVEVEKNVPIEKIVYQNITTTV